MQPQEKQEIRESLESGSQTLVDAVRGVTEELAGRSPGEGRWSILECVEHVAKVERYLLGQLECATLAETPMVNLQREAAIRVRAPTRSKRVEAPEPAKPSGHYATLSEALSQFLENRSRTLKFVETCVSDPRAQITTHPLLGTVNCYETLLLMAAHPVRHAEQIAEIRSALR